MKPGPRRKPGASIPNDERHTVQRLVRLTEAEDAALESVIASRGLDRSRTVGALAIEARLDAVITAHRARRTK